MVLCVRRKEELPRPRLRDFTALGQKQTQDPAAHRPTLPIEPHQLASMFMSEGDGGGCAVQQVLGRDAPRVRPHRTGTVGGDPGVGRVTF